MSSDPESVNFDMLELMNDQPIKGGQYSTHPMAMAFELCQQGEVYMMCQGAGSGYGDVLLRDPALVMKDIEEDLISDATARDIYKVVYDPTTLIVDAAATQQARADERADRLRRGKPFDRFLEAFVTAEPPEHLPYYGSWDDPTVVYGTRQGKRIKMKNTEIEPSFMLNPKDVKIARLESDLKAALEKLVNCEAKLMSVKER